MRLFIQKADIWGPDFSLEQVSLSEKLRHIGVAPITQLSTWVRKIVPTQCKSPNTVKPV